MKHTFTISYLACQTCQAHMHCRECGERLCGMLMGHQGVHSAAVNMPDHRLEIDSTLDSDTLEEVMEDFGIFAECVQNPGERIYS